MGKVSQLANCRLSYQTKEIMDSSKFYSHEVLEQLKILNINTNFHFERVLRFVIKYA